jgi:hypothetical protein
VIASRESNALSIVEPASLLAALLAQIAASHGECGTLEFLVNKTSFFQFHGLLTIYYRKRGGAKVDASASSRGGRQRIVKQRWGKASVMRCLYNGLGFLP